MNEIRCPECHKLLCTVPPKVVVDVQRVESALGSERGVVTKCRCGKRYEVILHPKAA